eukprot:gene24439-30785_t
MFKNELAVSKQTVSDMASQLLKSEETRVKVEEEATAARRDIEQLRSEGTARRAELEQWKTMYQELEAVVLAVKTQLSATQDGLGQELSSLREELVASRKDTKDSRVELRGVHHTLASITHDMDIISSFENQQNNQNGSGHVCTTTQRAEILALALSMQRSTASLDLTDGGDDQHSRSGTLSRINRDIQRVVAFMSDLLHRWVAQQEEGAALGQQLHQRSEAVTSASTLVSRFEEKYSSAKQELVFVDSALKEVVSMLQYCFPVATRDSGLVTRSNQSFLHQKSSHRGSPSKRDDVQRRSDFKSESRGELVAQLVQLVDCARKSVTETVPSLQNELVALRAQSVEELRTLTAHHEATIRRMEADSQADQQRLLNEIDSLRQENEDALVAVETTTYESRVEMKRIKEQCRARLGEDQLGLAAENSDLHSSLRTCNERYQSVALSLEHVLHQVTPLLDKYRTLQMAYSLLYKNWFHRSDLLVQGMHALSDCCSTIDDTLGSHHEQQQHHEEHIVHGKISTTRPSASSRDQRIKHIREQQHGDVHPDSKHGKPTRTRKLHSLRVVGLLVLAANRFLRHRYSRLSALDDQTNLVAVSTAREAGLSGCGEASFQSHFLVCYPAFDLPTMETLLEESSRVVTEQLLQAAAVDRQSGTSFSTFGHSSLLDVVKIHPYRQGRGAVDGLLCQRDMERVQATLLDTCSQVRHWRDIESQSQSIIDALQSRVSNMEDSLRQALVTEQAQQTRIDVLERERRFGSLTILRDIHNELKEHDAEVQVHNKVVKPSTAPPKATSTSNRRSAHFPSTDRSSSGSSHYETAAQSTAHQRLESDSQSEEEEEEEEEKGRDESGASREYSRDLREAMGQDEGQAHTSTSSLHVYSRPPSDSHLRPRHTTTTTTASSRYSNQSNSSSGEVYRAVKATRSSRFSNFSDYVAERDASRARPLVTARDKRFDNCEAQVRDMINDSVLSRSLSESEVADRSFDAHNTSINTFDSSDYNRSRLLDDSGYSSGSRSYSRSQSPSALPRTRDVSSAEKRAARAATNQSRDDDILEIYSDIGRLTGRLESRLRASSSATPEPVAQQR